MNAAAISERVDVVVVGGGPAGSTAATTLALQGRSVILLEKEHFPRYHIGESLLPYGWFTLQRLGVLDQVEQAGFQDKHSVQFVTPDGEVSRPFLFREHFDHEASRTWQVDRAAFDELLLRNAAARGVDVREGVAVTGLVHDAEGRVVGVHTGHGEVHAAAVIDATGRDGLTRRERGWSLPEPYLQRVALWTYYEGIPRDPGVHAGATTVVSLPGDGWAWFIPMRGDRVSVGVVARADRLGMTRREPVDLEAVWQGAVDLNPWLAARVRAGRKVDGVAVTRDYSYRARFCADDGLVLCGDAFAFLDPVFSSGVLLALRSGEEAALAVGRALDAGRVDAAAFEAYGEWLCEAIDRMRALVWSFYDPGFSMGQLVRAHPDLRGDVTELLIGNLFREYDALLAALAGFGVAPPVVDYGRAKASATAP